MLAWLSGLKGLLVAGLLAAVVGGGLWVYWHGRAVGVTNTSAKYEKLLREAEDRARAIEDLYASIERDHATQLSVAQADRDAAYAQARSLLRPVILRSSACPAVPELADAASSTDAATPADERPVQPQRDIGPALVMLAEQCDRAYAVAVGWQTWWAEVSAVR